MTDVLVIVEGVSKRFSKDRKPALKSLSAKIKPGQITGVVGPDGAGKTTLIRLIAGLLYPDQGTITVCGFDSRREADRIHEITGYMPQRFGLYEDLTVQENLNLYADLRDATGGERREAFERLLAFTGLKPFTNRLARVLSGGMKQKLGLACALIKKPRLLLLDEPSVGVDPISRRELWRMVNELMDEDVGVVWSTAYLDEAEKCESVILLNDGELLYEGAPGVLTAEVEGRTFQVRGIEGSKRAVLREALQQDAVIDSVIQGRHVRLVVGEDREPPSVSGLKAGVEARIVKVDPRFEDAFINRLGGVADGESRLAGRMPVIEKGYGTVVEATNLTKRFGNFAATDNVTFTIRRGEIFGLLGPNGAGKSTTFRMMCGLLKPTEGTARVAGLDLQKASGQARSRVGYMAQKFSLYGNLSVRQNLNFFSGVYGLTGSKRRDAIEDMVDIFDLKPYLNTPADELPLGFKQRLALSCAVMHHPAVLFLDEPTSGVDPITWREFWTHINGMVEKGVTIVVTTHFMEEAEYCDRIGLMYRGKLIAVGSPDELKGGVRSEEMPEPTLEDAFILLIEKHDENQKEAA